MKFKVKTLSDHEKFCAEVDRILAQLPKDMEATELLNSNIFGRVFVALADTFTGVIKTLYSNFANFSKTVKRSELREFVDSNRMKMNTVDRIDYVRMSKVYIDIPANLSGSYVQTINTLAKCYAMLNTVNTAKVVESTVTDVFKAFTNSSANKTTTIKNGAALIGKTVAAAKQAVQNVNTKFSGTFAEKMLFNEVFTTSNEFEEARKLLLDLDHYLQDAQPIAASIKIIESTLRGISEQLGKDSENTLSKEDLVHFGEMLKQSDLVFSSFGMCTTRHLALEHNYVLAVNTIYNSCK